ncbi:protein of unknown function [Nonlabens sp. Hel1_33_55]|uniref:DUF4301 family protein n=1 Tax=Nonlabens sp. Hel1_33_55 TaxID=1336802 RepID=UPI000875C670|nr:DUF4301 family protein [Nonlabens sp. Hel1_33_55]SCY36304.1 protein of unknown function [Nonlabens sp. Hel1_33_55]
MELTATQEEQLKEKGISKKTLEQQIHRFVNGFPTVKLKKAAVVGDGILRISDSEIKDYVEFYDSKREDLDILKFVPASGAATRMFKFLHEFLQEYDASEESINSFINRKNARDLFTFFVGIEKFPFYDAVIESLKKGIDNWQSLSDRDKKERFVRKMLFKNGFNFSAMPKGLVPFHSYGEHKVTAFEEHLHEASGYAATKNEARLHFTIAQAYKNHFVNEFDRIEKAVEESTGKNYEISFSYQKPSTDTVAVDMQDKPIVNKDGTLFFRPAGHGALLDNLNEQDADLIFIKNIDNVTVSNLDEDVSVYKKMLAGVLLKVQEKAFTYLENLQTDSIEDNAFQEMEEFILEQLMRRLPRDYHKYTTIYKREALIEALNRPLRVCGMVKNEGEPGGGPFWVTNEYGQSSLQIVESAQVDDDDYRQRNIAANCTHFNPVDIVCGVRDYQGNKFDLADFRDLETGFITHKSRKGHELKAQELPGLWNGAMAHWNTIFVEVPLITFNPVKTVNDLLKPAHQG